MIFASDSADTDSAAVEASVSEDGELLLSFSLPGGLATGGARLRVPILANGAPLIDVAVGLYGESEAFFEGTAADPEGLLERAPAAWNVLNNGHTIQVEGKDGGYATIDGERFDLLQFHFHTPSEHTIDGRNYPMEVHFVHKNAEGRLAVIGVLMMPGGENSLFSTIMEKAPKEEGSASVGMIEQRGMIAPIDGVYRYQGSLTTPPCSETVLWTVLSTPILVSQKDVEAFQALFPMNARPIQPVNRRYVLRD